jgi:hypothetical protein
MNKYPTTYTKDSHSYQDIIEAFNAHEALLSIQEIEGATNIAVGRPINLEKDYLYNLAEEILEEEGFWFSHCYWNLDPQKHKLADEDNDPAIGMSCPREDGSFTIYTIVELDIYSSHKVGGIHVNSEAQVRAVLSALILLIKNWHERLIKQKEEFLEEN